MRASGSKSFSPTGMFEMKSINVVGGSCGRPYKHTGTHAKYSMIIGIPGNRF